MQKNTHIIPYLGVVFLIVAPWFFQTGYLFFTDFSWGPHVVLDWQNNWFLVHVIVWLGSYVLPVSFLQKLFVSGVFLLVLFGGKKMITEILRYFETPEKDISRWFVFGISVFMLFNPFVYDRVMYGQFGVVAAFGFLAFAFGYILAYFRERDNKYMILAGISLGGMMIFSMHFIFFAFVLMGLVFIDQYIKKEILWLSFLKGLFLMSVIIVAINANWLISMTMPDTPLRMFVSEGITDQDFMAFQTAGDTNKEVITNVFMMSGFWGKDQFRYQDLTNFTNNWGKSFFILLPVILLGAWIGLKNKKTRIFSIGLLVIMCMSVILAIGVRLPLAREISQFLYDYVPFYKGLREPQKWVAVLVLVYGSFLSVGSLFLLKYTIIRHNRLMIGIFFVAVIIMQAPLLLGGFSGQAHPARYPRDWYQAHASILKDQNIQYGNNECTDGVLFLPWHLYMSFSWAKTIMANPAQQFFTCPVFYGTNMEWGGIYDNSNNPNSALISKWLSDKGNNDFLLVNNLNIRYIVLAKEQDWQNHLWIENIPGIQIVQDTETLRLYIYHYE